MFTERGPYRQPQALCDSGDTQTEDFAIRSLEFLTSSILACQRDGYLTGLALRRRTPFAGLDPGAVATRAVEVMMALTAATRSSPPSASVDR